MERIETGNGQPLISQTARAPVLVGRGTTRSASDNKGSTFADLTTTSVARSQVNFGRLQAINEHSNREALRIRTDERNAHRADQLLAEMKETLYRVIKNYPPYPSSDPERAKFLMSFNGLKREIEQMTVPPENTASSQLIGTTDSGIGRSDIPSLGQQATNSEIQFAIRQIGQASSAGTAQAPSSAATDPSRGVPNEKIAVLATIAGQDLNLMIPGEAEAGATSIRVRQDLAGAMNGSITAAQSQLLALAG